jgi:hypothetical protein
LQRPARFCRIGNGSVNLSKVFWANAARAFRSKFDAGGVANKARSKIAITLVTTCNSEIALNGPFSAHGEVHTDMRQLPAEFRRRHPAERRDGQFGELSFRCRHPAGK